MTIEIFTLMGLSILAVLCICILIGIRWYDRKLQNSSLSKRNANDWLFNGFHRNVFNLVYKRNAEKYCGIKVEDFERYKKILHADIFIEDYVGMRIEAVTILILLLTAAVFYSSSTVITVIFIFLAAASFFLLYVMPYSRLKDKAGERLFQIQDDLPRFLSLLDKAMSLPIDQAMLLTASRFESPLSEDIIDSINKVALGENGWQTTLYDLAKTYNIPDFSDLVLEIINSYDRGIDITVMINRKSYEIEQNRMYDVEAHDSKIKTTIFLPIILLKILPLMVMIVLPMVSDFVT